MVQDTASDELREELEQMFASAWQDGVHHLSPRYLRRDTFFTDRAMALIKQHELDAKKAKTEESKSICGCSMCEFHVEAYVIMQRKGMGQ